MEVFSIVFPVLLIPLFGYLCVKLDWLSIADSDAISKFTFTLLIPALLFIAMIQMQIPDDINWNFLSAYYLGVFAIYLLSIFMGAVLFKFTIPEQSVFGMGASYSNATIVGMPVCLYALGEEAMLPLFIIISIHNLALFSIGIIAAERNSLRLNSLLQRLLQLVLQLVKNPITGSLIFGIILNLLNVSLPDPVEDAFKLFSRGAVPAALFVLGASMNKYQIRGHMRPALLTILLKMIAMPLLVWILAFHVFSLPLLWAATALLTSSMPVGINAYIFSQRYGVGAATVSTAIVLSTLCSIVTLTLVLTYIHRVII